MPGAKNLVHEPPTTSPPGARDPRPMKTIEIEVDTGGRRGLWDLTAACQRFARDASDDGDGLVVIFVPHATAGLVVVELGAAPTPTSWRRSTGCCPVTRVVTGIVTVRRATAPTMCCHCWRLRH